jgi:hypothetical protein
VSAPVICGTAAGGSTFVFVRLIVKLSTNWNDTTSTHVARAPCSTEALSDLIYEGLAEPRFFGLGRGSRFGENWSVYFSDSITAGKLKGSHLFASVIHASRKRV